VTSSPRKTARCDPAPHTPVVRRRPPVHYHPPVYYRPPVVYYPPIIYHGGMGRRR
jgi:hypothetical protein